MLAEVFAKGGINLLYGESGVGKTLSTIKALNKDGIEPILVDFDNNASPQQSRTEFIHLDGYKLMKLDNPTLPTNEVIIVDTWQLYITNGGNMSFLNTLNKIGNTIIVIAHNKPIATKQDIPDIDHKMANHFDGKLWFERKMIKNVYHYRLHILKLRGYTGEPIIDNWMRD